MRVPDKVRIPKRAFCVGIPKERFSGMSVPKIREMAALAGGVFLLKEDFGRNQFRRFL